MLRRGFTEAGTEGGWEKLSGSHPSKGSGVIEEGPRQPNTLVHLTTNSSDIEMHAPIDFDHVLPVLVLPGFRCSRTYNESP